MKTINTLMALLLSAGLIQFNAQAGGEGCSFGAERLDDPTKHTKTVANALKERPSKTPRQTTTKSEGTIQ